MLENTFPIYLFVHYKIFMYGKLNLSVVGGSQNCQNGNYRAATASWQNYCWFLFFIPPPPQYFYSKYALPVQ